VLRLILLSAALVLGCTNDKATVRTLKSSGFTKIQTTGFALGCSDSDYYATGFTATNPAGEVVSGVVCCGAWTKGCTVRF
jgi:hypothetical protein